VKEKLLPYFILFCAVGLSFTAAYYSVIGLSILFASVAIPVIVMGSFLEISKIAIATYLHDHWKKTYVMLKIYLTIALVVLSFITSLGIYGLLTTGFQENISKMEIGDKRIANIEVKKKRFEEIKSELTVEKQTLDKDISNLRNALSTNTTTQTVDQKTGQLITKANNGNRAAFESQLTTATENKNAISKKIEVLNDSLTNIEIQILDMQSEAELGNELGAVKYVSEITGKPIKQIANIFILLIIFVFDPLAIVLVIATNQAFANLKPVMSMYGEPKPDITPLKQPLQKQKKAESKTPSKNEDEIKHLEKEIQRIKKSGAIGKRTEAAVKPLQEKLNKLKKEDEDQIEY
jgi:hypothetical protein